MEYWFKAITKTILVLNVKTCCTGKGANNCYPQASISPLKTSVP
jgi:hypothetical protein